MAKDVIIACDFAGRQQTLDFLGAFEGHRKPFVKIGMELFYAEGPDIVREIKRRGHPVFLDLKLHDIPNTVKKAMRVLSALDVDIVNVHAAGTVEMMRAALEGLTRPDGTRPLLIAVTQLTSTSEERMQKELLIGAGINETIVKYAQNAREAFVVYPNIRVVKYLGDTVRGPEGCLSIPGRRGIVPRSEGVVISWTDPEALEPRTEEIHGYTAIIFQHETDHLDGILYTDRADSVFANPAWEAERAPFAAKGAYDKPAWWK